MISILLSELAGGNNINEFDKIISLVSPNLVGHKNLQHGFALTTVLSWHHHQKAILVDDFPEVWLSPQFSRVEDLACNLQK